MVRTAGILFAAGLCFFAGPHAALADEDALRGLKAKHQQLSTRIVGGSPVPNSNDDYAFMVSLQEEGFGHYCGGSLISPTVVLTAAHCQSGYPDPDFVVIGAHDLSKSNDGVKVGVKNVIIHPDYSNSGDDMALIILDEAVNSITPVALSDPAKDGGVFEKDGTVSKVIGWGTMEEGANNLPDKLQQVEVPLVSREQCTAKGAYSPGDILKENVCAGYKSGGKDSCQGDSGGPLFTESVQGKPVTQVGVVSWGEGCARKNKYGVYARVSSYLKWIRANVKDLPSSGPPSPSPPPSPQPTPSPVVGTPADWDLFDREMKFCKKKGKKQRKCKKLSSRCVWDSNTCQTNLINDPAYQTPAPTMSPTSSNPDEYDSYGSFVDPCFEFFTKKSCKRAKVPDTKCVWLKKWKVCMSKV